MLSASSPSRDAGVGDSSSRRPNTSVSPNTLAVSASVSGVAKWKTPCGARERGVHAVAELVRERQHVAPPRRVVEHHVRRARSARCRSRTRRRACPAAPGRRSAARRRTRARVVAQLGREARERVEHHVLRARPRDRLVLVDHRGHAVVVGEPVEAEQLRLQAVPAARQLVAAADGLDQRLDGLVGRLVGEVAARQPVRVGAQPVVDHLLGEQRVEHEAAHAQPGLQRRGHRTRRSCGARRGRGRRGARARSRAPRARRRPAGRRRSPAACSSNRRDHALLDGERLLGEDPLLGLGQQVRAVAPRGAQVVAAEVQAVVGEQLVGARRPRGRPTRARRTAASVSICVPRSCTFCSSAPRSGSAVAVAKRSIA